MENRSHALAAGAFVLAVMALLVALAFWLTRDNAVRRTWQIGADRVHIKGRHWNAMLEGVVEMASTGLGAGAGVEGCPASR